MVFYELEDIEKMLDNTQDPIGIWVYIKMVFLPKFHLFTRDFINAACSDVIAFCATLTYEEFLERTSHLNE